MNIFEVVYLKRSSIAKTPSVEDELRDCANFSIPNRVWKRVSHIQICDNLFQTQQHGIMIMSETFQVGTQMATYLSIDIQLVNTFNINTN